MKNQSGLGICLLLGAFLLLTSCIDIDSHIVLDENGSGTVEFTYKVAEIAMNLGAAEKDRTLLPIPVGEADLRRTVLAVPGLALESYSRSTEGENAVVKAKLSFRDIEALDRFAGREGITFALKKEGDNVVFEQILSPGNPDGIDEKTRRFFEAFFMPYRLRFTLTAPKNVKNAGPVKSEIAGRDARVSLSFIEIAESREPLLWRVEW